MQHNVIIITFCTQIDDVQILFLFFFIALCCSFITLCTRSICEQNVTLLHCASPLLHFAAVLHCAALLHCAVLQ